MIYHFSRVDYWLRFLTKIPAFRFLHDSGFIVFLNKQDLLQEKVESGHSIGDHFPQYENYSVNPKEDKCDDEYTKTKFFIRDLFLVSNELLLFSFVWNLSRILNYW